MKRITIKVYEDVYDKLRWLSQQREEPFQNTSQLIEALIDYVCKRENLNYRKTKQNG